jgi:tetratricopeptide (TPR) repeat protein
MPRSAIRMRSSRRASRAGAAAVAIVLALLLPRTAAARGLDALPAAPTDSQRYDACLARARNNPADALAAAEEWRRAGGGFPADHCAAVSLIGLKRYPEAAQRLEAMAGAMMRAAPAMRADTLDQAGQAWLLADQAAEARAAFDAALTLKPNDPDLFIDRAEAEAAEGRFADAVEDLDHALASEPDRAEALIYRASAYRRLGKLDQALADADRALALAPHAVAGLLERGNIRRLEGNDGGAQADWQEVEALAPGSPAAAAARQNLARIAARGDEPAK